MNSQLNNNDLGQVSQTQATDSSTLGRSAAAAVGQVAREVSAGLGASAMVIWPQFHIGADGRVYV